MQRLQLLITIILFTFFCILCLISDVPYALFLWLPCVLIFHCTLIIVKVKRAPSINILYWTCYVGIIFLTPLYFLTYENSFADRVGKLNFFEWYELIYICFILNIFILVCFVSYWALSSIFSSFTREVQQKISRVFLLKNHTSLLTKRKKKIFSILLCIFIITLLPLNNFFYGAKAGIVGVDPDPLPMKLAGIYYYSIHYLMPLVLSLLFLRSSQSFLILVIVIFYLIWITILTVSKGPIIIFALIYLISSENLDLLKKFLVLILLLFSFLLTAVLRSYQLAGFNSENSFKPNLSFSNIVKKISENISNSEENIFEIFVSIVMQLINRFDGVQNYILASSYDASKVGGGFGVFLNVLYNGIVTIDPDSHHIQWQNYIPPEGVFHSGGLFSEVIIMTNSNVSLLLAVGFVIGAFCLVTDKFSAAFCKKYPVIPVRTITFILILGIIARGGINYQLVFILIVLGFLSQMKKIRIK